MTFIKSLSFSAFFAVSFAILYSVQILSTPTVSSPLFMWANDRYFSGVNVQTIDLITIEDIKNMLKNSGVLESSLGSLISTEAKTPEVFVVYIEPSLTTEQVSLVSNARQAHSDGGSLIHLKQLIEKSASSAVLPYIAPTSSVGDAVVATLISNLPSQSTIVIVKETADVDVPQSLLSTKGIKLTMTMEELKNQLKSANQWNILHNGIPDLVVVCFDSVSSSLDVCDIKMKETLSSDDSILNTLDTAFKHTSYVSFFAAEDSLALPLRAYFFETSSHAIRSFEQRFPQATDDNYPNHWPDSVVEGLIVIVPFFFILSIAIYCICGLQSGMRFELEKEFQKKHFGTVSQ